MAEYIKCPFCNEDDYDLIGLKNHLENGGCAVYNDTMSIEEESKLRHLKWDLEEKMGDNKDE